MIFKALILFIAICYVHSSPIDKNELNSKSAEDVLLKNDQPVELPKIPTTEEEVTEKRSARIARNNKVEYVYVNSNGEIIQPLQNAPPKDYHRIINSENLPYTHNSVDNYPTTTILKNNNPQINPINEKVIITGRSSDLSSDDKLESPSSLQYAAGNVKIRQENLKTRGLSNSAQSQQQQNSPLISSPLNYQFPYSSYPLISSPYSSYPLLQNSYNPLFGGGLYSNYYSQSYLDPYLSSSSNLLSRISNPLSANYLGQDYLFGRQFNPIGYTPANNPFIPFLLPQQTPNLNYLLNRGIGLGGLGGIGLNGYDGLIPPYLYPNYSPINYPNFYPQQIVYPNFYPQQQASYPLASQQQTLLPSTPVVQPETAFVSRRVSTTPTVVSTTTTSTNVEPFTDSVVAPAVATVFNSPSSVSNSPSIVMPGNVESAPSVSSSESNEKPLLYANQNAQLRTHSPIYDSTYYHGANYGLNSAYNYNRFIDPLTGLPIYRYPYNSPYSRLTGYYGSNGYSSIYRPGYIGTYPPNNYFNNIGMIPFNSPMHYSADPTSLLSGRSADKNEEKATVVSGKGDQSKENNLMYTIKTSKQESKETVSRLNNLDTPKGLGLDDKKA